MTQVFVDMDGVLADFDTHHETHFGVRPSKLADNVEWHKVRAIPNFYRDIPPMPDAYELWDFVTGLDKAPIVLTGIPHSVEEAASNKRAWVEKHLGKRFQVICCPSKEKSLYCQPGDVLIDDWEKYKHLWVQKGGRWITHTSASKSIDELLEMGIGL